MKNNWEKLYNYLKEHPDNGVMFEMWIDVIYENGDFLLIRDYNLGGDEYYQANKILDINFTKLDTSEISPSTFALKMDKLVWSKNVFSPEVEYIELGKLKTIEEMCDKAKEEVIKHEI